jgi:hypothetical protein
VPRWNVALTAQTLGLQSKLPFDASKGATLIPSVILDGRHLKLRGLIFNTVQFQSAVLDGEALRLPGPSTDAANASSILIVAHWTCLADAKASVAYIGDQLLLIAFARTLTAERYIEEYAHFQADRFAYCLRVVELSQKDSGGDVSVIQRRAEGGNVSAFEHHAWYFCHRRIFLYTEGGIRLCTTEYPGWRYLLHHFWMQSALCTSQDWKAIPL